MQEITEFSIERKTLRSVWSDYFTYQCGWQSFLKVCEYAKKHKGGTTAYIESVCYSKFRDTLNISNISIVVDLVKYMDILLGEYDNTLLVYTKTPKVIAFYKGSKSAHTWGQGEIQGTPFTQLSYGSPLHKGDKRILIFCHTKDFKQ